MEHETVMSKGGNEERTATSPIFSKGVLLWLKQHRQW